MSKYVVVNGFKDGKSENGQAIRFVVGQDYDGARVKELLAAGLIKPKADLINAKLKVLKAELAAKQAEVDAQLEKLAAVGGEPEKESKGKKDK